MDPGKIRTVVIQAVFSDALLMEQLVLKGGNALELGFGVVTRGSIDVDFSIQDDFEDPEEIEGRLHRALQDRFDAHDIVVFDWKFGPVPVLLVPDTTPWWGGYRATFKLLPRPRYEALRSHPAKAQIEALPIAPNQERNFTIDISKHEFCEKKEEVDLEGFRIFLYTPAMLAIEKLRAICQQMPEYLVLKNKRPRARDFYDIHAIVRQLGVDLGSEENLPLFRPCFEAKRVPLRSLGRIHEPKVREYHRLTWPAVMESVQGERPEEFDYYFDFVSREVSRLKTFWEE